MFELKILNNYCIVDVDVDNEDDDKEEEEEEDNIVVSEIDNKFSISLIILIQLP